MWKAGEGSSRRLSCIKRRLLGAVRFVARESDGGWKVGGGNGPPTGEGARGFGGVFVKGEGLDNPLTGGGGV